MAPNGDIFVADGHGDGTNARIVKFSKDGKFIKAWGKEGNGPGEFNVPHGLAFDSAGRLFVADRANNRIQIFDQDGKLLDTWKQFGRPSGITIDKNDMIYVADSQSGDKLNPGFKQGIRVGNVKDGKVTSFIEETKFLGALEGVGGRRRRQYLWRLHQRPEAGAFCEEGDSVTSNCGVGPAGPAALCLICR